jgi:MFS family permease
MTRKKLHFLFLNVGHFLDHLFMLVFATVAALALTREWQLSYGELIPYAMPGFIAFGAFALPAGWLADKWSRHGMLVIFFIGIGAASIATALAQTPLQIGIGLFAIGVFAAIYHPVGIALVLEGRRRVGMAIAVNGVYGNMGVAAAALITGYLIDQSGWRSAFVWPGIVSIGIGIAYGVLIWSSRGTMAASAAADKKAPEPDVSTYDQALFVRVIAIVLFTTALGGLVFQSTTFALPKIVDERAGDIAASATLVGWLAFFIFSIGSIGQLVVGYAVDRISPRIVFAAIAATQLTIFALMPGLHGWPAIILAAVFMFATFGQIPINDVLVGRVAKSEWRSRILALRMTVTISVMALSVPVIAWVHAGWGFDLLFVLLAIAGGLILSAALQLPRAIPAPVVLSPAIAPARDPTLTTPI